MRTLDQKTYYSATDICNFSECRYLTYRDRSFKPDKDTLTAQSKLVIEKGQEHENSYIATLTVGTSPIPKICDGDNRHPEYQFERTKQFLAAGHEYLAQVMLTAAPFSGIADLLRRVDRPSNLGNYSYVVLDTKLSKKEKTSHIIQLCFYSDLLASIQGVLPQTAYIIDGNRREVAYPIDEYFDYYRTLKRDFLRFISSPKTESIEPEPCPKCLTCHWNYHCNEVWNEKDDLCRIARISSSQRKKLVSADINTVKQLAQAPEEGPQTLHPRLYRRLKKQAELQTSSQQPCFDFISPHDGGSGFCFLPTPSPNDLFYDIEADPLIKNQALDDQQFDLRDGLEYLHGISYRESNGSFGFTYFLATHKASERKAYEDLIDFFEERCSTDSNAHIYHYSPYETAALRRLAAQYPTRTEKLDRLYREQRFIDLYAIVRNAIQVSEPRYSIKNLEVFYAREKRTQGVKGGGDSIVFFEEYLKTGNRKLLEDIIEYNRRDCESTIELYDWLSQLKSVAAKQFKVDWNELTHRQNSNESEEKKANRDANRAEADARIERYGDLFRIHLLDSKEDSEMSELEDLNRKFFYLADFYRQENKPVWWEFFNLKRDREARTNSNITITQCLRDHSIPEGTAKKSRLVHYHFNPRAASESKLSIGDKVYDLENDQDFGSISDIELTEGRIAIKLKGAATVYDIIDLTRAPQIMTNQLDVGLDRFLTILGEINFTPEKLLKRDYPYAALVDILRKIDPVLKKPATISALILSSSTEDRFTQELLDLAMNLDRSYLFIQGPPGTGKTYHGARLALELIKSGKSVGLTSNSHKAVNNFLNELDRQAYQENVDFRGLKKSDSQKPESCYQQDPALTKSCIKNVFKNEDLLSDSPDIIAGTAWAFIADALDQTLDYLIVDEASQLSIAHLVAAGISAINIILIGDPQQLPQPLQGTHFAELDKSPLELLLGSNKVVPPSRGVFLETSRRMHTEICDVLSKHVYANKLIALPENSLHAIINPAPKLIPKCSGLLFLEVAHSGRVSAAPEEVDLIKDLIHELRDCSFRSSTGHVKPLNENDIMVVAPYNLQVRALKAAIPYTRIGTIDLFQGQQAPVTIISMTTSDLNESIRGIDFLFSMNRINVALSRAQALAIIVASPELLRLRCKTPAQMHMVNFFCALKPPIP